MLILLPDRELEIPQSEADSVYSGSGMILLTPSDWSKMVQYALDWRNGEPMWVDAGYWWLDPWSGMFETFKQKVRNVIQASGVEPPRPQTTIQKATPWLLIGGGLGAGFLLLYFFAKKKFK